MRRNPGPTGGRNLEERMRRGNYRFSKEDSYHHSLVAELWIIMDGLTVTINMGMHVLHVESDAHEVINLIVQNKKLDRPLIPLIIDCKKFV